MRERKYYLQIVPRYHQLVSVKAMLGFPTQEFHEPKQNTHYAHWSHSYDIPMTFLSNIIQLYLQLVG